MATIASDIATLKGEKMFGQVNKRAAIYALKQTYHQIGEWISLLMLVIIAVILSNAASRPEIAEIIPVLLVIAGGWASFVVISFACWFDHYKNQLGY